MFREKSQYLRTVWPIILHNRSRAAPRSAHKVYKVSSFPVPVCSCDTPSIYGMYGRDRKLFDNTPDRWHYCRTSCDRDWPRLRSYGSAMILRPQTFFPNNFSKCRYGSGRRLEFLKACQFHRIF